MKNHWKTIIKQNPTVKQKYEILRVFLMSCKSIWWLKSAPNSCSK